MKNIETRGATFPALGFGTWELQGAACRDAVSAALDIGYRHIDTAQAYENEAEVGEALRQSGVERSEVWLTTKIWHENLAPEAVESSTRESLEKLQTGYVDLLLIHWPSDEVPLADTLHAMATLRDEGRVRHLGVANFTPSLMIEALASYSIVCNQVEFHPLLNQDQLVSHARALEVAITAYSPLARGRISDNKTLAEIGARYGKSAAQVSLRWLLERGMAAIPKASKRAHAEANFDIFDFELSPKDVATITGLGGEKRLIDPPFAPNWERES